MQSARKTYGFYIDIFSHCNLRCPTCIVGNKFGDIQAWPRGLIAPEFLGRILDKALSECEIEWVGLYNWTEPLLHPNLPALVREVKSRKLVCWLSSNLNVLPHPEDLLAENPDFFRVSLSGFTQKVYEVGHRSGDIEKVKQNMVRLAAAKAKSASNSYIEVLYHRYIHNAAEIAPMEAFTRALGFEFKTCLAQIFPVEKIINISEGRTTAEDRDILAKLSLPLDRALEVTAREPKTNCKLLDEQIALDIQGNVMLCPSSSMERSNAVGNFLDFPLQELQRRREQQMLCRSCLKLGIPDYLLATPPEFEDIAAEMIASQRAVFAS